MSMWQVKLCDPFVTHGPYLSALDIELYKFVCLLLLYSVKETMHHGQLITNRNVSRWQ